jgi:glycosyltransferase involved in cell wall biosynthesis
VRDLADLPGVAVTGRVSDVRPYLSSASVAVVPLRICRGIQNKVLEAMAMGMPVVATPAAFEGIEAEPGTDLLVARDPQAFARHVCELIDDADARSRLGQAARKRVELRYCWDVPLRELDAVLHSVTCHRRESRPLTETPTVSPATACS